MVVYLDNATTGHPKPEAVFHIVESVMRRIGSSPGRGGGLKREADTIVFESRENIKEMFNIKSSENVVFTPNVTTSINLALKGILKKGDHIITSPLEHNAVVRPLISLEKIGIVKTVIGCSPNGIIKFEDIEKGINPSTRMIIINHASNVVGTISPIRRIGEIARRHNLLFLVDAAQTAGLLPIDVERDNIDLLACTGHKFLFGPQGTGFLYIRNGVKIEPLIEGGTGSSSESEDMPDFLPDRYEAGTLNTAGIAGLSAGIDFLRRKGMDVIREKIISLVAKLLDGLYSIPGVVIYGTKDPKNTVSVISFNLKYISPSELGYLLNKRYNIVCRVGLHCAPWAHRTIGTFPEGTVRVSVGYFNKIEDINKFLKAVEDIAHSS